jgi:S-adenosylmethionine-diacylgycerolhomoserine-N-methlytransferase
VAPVATWWQRPRAPRMRCSMASISPVRCSPRRSRTSRSNAADRIFLAQGDAETFNACRHFKVSGFDRIFLSYTVSMIPGWQQAVRHSLTQLKPSGSLHLVDFGTMDAWPGTVRNLMRRWLAGFHVEPRADLGEHMVQLAADNSLNVQLSRLGGGYAVIASIGSSVQPASRTSAQDDGVDWFTHAMQP